MRTHLGEQGGEGCAWLGCKCVGLVAPAHGTDGPGKDTDQLVHARYALRDEVELVTHGLCSTRGRAPTQAVRSAYYPESTSMMLTWDEMALAARPGQCSCEHCFVWCSMQGYVASGPSAVSDTEGKLSMSSGIVVKRQVQERTVGWRLCISSFCVFCIVLKRFVGDASEWQGQ